MIKIAFFDTEKSEEEYFRKSFPDHELYFSENSLEDVEKHDPEIYNSEIICIFAYSKAHKQILDKFPNLKYLATRSTGFDHIDLEYCKYRGITVSNVPTYGMHSVAEHTFALILAISQKIVPSVNRTRHGDFSLDGLRGFELYGKTLGIVGTGNIGKVVAEIALGFGMKVIAYSRHDDDELKSKGVVFKDMDSVLGESDIVTLHLPYNKETHHIINLGNINKFKKGVVFINNARGGLVETQAILEALNQGIFSAAGLDVLEEEFGIREESELITSKYIEKRDLKTGLLNHILLDRDDVFITPHNAFDSYEAVAQILDTTAKNIKSYISGNVENVIVEN